MTFEQFVLVTFDFFDRFDRFEPFLNLSGAV